MDNRLGLPGLIVLDDIETWGRVRFEAEVGAVLCAKCGSADALGDPVRYLSVVINDTPCRGRPTEIRIKQYTYRCRRCARTFVGAAPEIDTRRKMTLRLIRYIQDSVMRQPRSRIAKEVGISTDRVKAIALDMAKRLGSHKFPTPRVLGIDDIKMNKKTYMIFTDSERGHAIGLIGTATRVSIEDWIVAKLDRTRVEVVVSDLAPAIAEAVEFALPHAVHVVDRWHVLQAGQKATSAVITQTLTSLDKEAEELEASGVKSKANGPGRKATTIRNLRPDLLGRVKGKRPAGKESLFDETLLRPVLSDHESISHAFWARIDLAKVYHQPDEVAARQQLARFYAAARHATIVKEMAGVVKRITKHERLIFNYFTAQVRFPDVAAAALTTSSTENRNGKLRRSWKAGRGVRNLAYLRMLALYEPWRLDRDILMCGGVSAGVPCQNVEGPVPLVPGLVGQDPDQPMTLPPPWRCETCCPKTSAAVQAV